MVAKLEAAGALIVSGKLAYFDHHLKHDYLAALFLAEHPERWERGAFDVVTFQASSFDTLALVLEQLPEVQGDAFVRAVYDWNPYGAAYAAAEIQHRGRSAVSGEMEHVILAVLAERTRDLMVFTAQRATDALNLFRTPEAARFRDAPTLEAAFQLVAEVHSDKEWFSRWRSIFTKPRGWHPGDAELGLIRDTDSVVGWTFANVLKRSSLSENQQDRMRALSVESVESPTIRWRVAHVLGSFPTLVNAQFLFQVFGDDSDPWVRFGAVRSLVEIAARGDPGVRDAVFAGLTERAEGLRVDKISLSEFRRAVFIRKENTPQGWLGSVARVLEALHRNSRSLEELERWERFAYDLRVAYTQ